MSVVLDGSFIRLRLNHRSGEGGDFAQAVAIVDRIPAGATVFARVDRPTALPETDDIQVARRGQPTPASPVTPPTGMAYVIEHAPRPVVAPASSAGSALRSRIRTLSVIPGTPGVFQPAQQEAAWAAFAPAVSGSKVPEGANPHSFVVAEDKQAILAGLDTPSAKLPAGELVRARWQGVAVAAGVTQGPDAGPGFDFAANSITRNDGGDWTTEFVVGDYVVVALATNPANDGVWGPITNVTAGVLTIASGGLTISAGDNTATFTRDTALITLAGGETSISGSWTLRGDQNLVPGSIVLTLPGPYTVRDTGDGRLVGQGAAGELFDGEVNYFTGAWALRIGGVVIGAGDITAVYEHGCLYAPIDIHLQWDALCAQ